MDHTLSTSRNKGKSRSRRRSYSLSFLESRDIPFGDRCLGIGPGHWVSSVRVLTDCNHVVVFYLKKVPFIWVSQLLPRGKGWKYGSTKVHLSRGDSLWEPRVEQGRGPFLITEQTIHTNDPSKQRRQWRINDFTCKSLFRSILDSSKSGRLQTPHHVNKWSPHFKIILYKSKDKWTKDSKRWWTKDLSFLPFPLTVKSRDLVLESQLLVSGSNHLDTGGVKWRTRERTPD